MAMALRELKKSGGKVLWGVGIDPFNKRIDRNSDDNLTEARPAP